MNSGWAGTVLRINLTTRQFRKEPLDEQMRLQFLGGRGINSRLLFREVGPDTDPLGPDNVIVFGSGPLSGTLAPACARCTVTAKSPLTGILGDANFGGFFAPVMKKAGVDHIIIQGCSEKPVTLLITGERVEFRDASRLWGKTTAEAERLLRQEHRNLKPQVALIGPAGENRVRMACVVHKYNVAGRTGMGAVMGSKNLKAVCVAGSGRVKIALPDAFRAECRKWKQNILENPFCKFFSTYGSAGPLKNEDGAGILAVKNFSQTCGFEQAEQISAAALKKYFTRSNACFACPVHCIQSFEVTEGPYRGTRGAKMPEGCNSACGPSCGNADPGSLFKMIRLANDYGIDILDFGLLMSIAMDWYENGIIGNADTDGICLNWGNHRAMVTMLEKIAHREGIGNILADGAVRAAEHIGRNAAEYVSDCKGMIFGGVDVRVLRGSSLCYATASRGFDHLRGGILFELPSKDGKSAMPAEEAVQKFGTADALDPLSYNKAAAAAYCQDLYTAADCLQVCKFITAHGSDSHGITLQHMADMFHAVTGVRLGIDALRNAAGRVFTLERAFLAREGITRKDDVIGGKAAGAPVPGGRYKGAAIEPDKWNRMLSDYYELRGWDPATGIPTRATLQRLGLGAAADELERLGSLP